MNAATIRPLLVSTKRVFDKMLEFPCRIGKPTVMRAFDSVPDSYQAIVEVGGTHEGYLVLTLPEAVADIAATLLDVSDDDGPAAQCSQAAYLLARMIAAVARRKTAPTGMKLKAVRSCDPGIESSGLNSMGPWLVAPFVGRFGEVSFALSMRPAAIISAPAEPITAVRA